MLPKVKYTFNNNQVGEIVGNAGTLANWFIAGQGGNASEEIVSGQETNRLRANNEPGLWVSTFKSDQTYTDFDFTAIVNNYLLYAGARVTIDSAVAPSGYGVQIYPAGGGVAIYKACFGAFFFQASTTITPFSNDFKLRVTMNGEVMDVYVNDVLVLSFDFTGSSPCGASGFGYMSMTTFNSTIVFDPGDKTPSYTLMEEV